MALSCSCKSSIDEQLERPFAHFLSDKVSMHDCEQFIHIRHQKYKVRLRLCVLGIKEVDVWEKN